VTHKVIDSGAQVVFLAGGEPLLHPQIYWVAEECTRAGLDVYVNTNGLLLNSESAYDLANHGVSGVVIGVDGINAAKHESIRGTGTFKRALAALDVARTAGMTAELDFTLNALNAEQLSQLPAWGDSLGLNRVTIKRYVPRPSSEHDLRLRLSPTSLSAAYNELLSECPDPTTRAGCRVYAHDPLMLVAKAERGLLREGDILREDCNAAAFIRGWIGVSADGHLSPCPVMTEVGVRICDIPDIRTALASRQFSEVRDKLPIACFSCTHASYCRGGCRATKLRLRMGLNVVDPCCWVGKGAALQT